MSEVLRLENVGHSFAGRKIIEGIELSVAAGESFALLGRSGSGKTTLLRAIAGLLLPDTGRVILNGHTVAGGGRELIAAEKRGVGLVFQDFALFPYLSVGENIAFGISRAPDRAARVQHLLERVRLQGFADRSPRTLSGGQQQRVALARALAPGPKIMLLDEPFANLDGELRAELGDELRVLLRELGVAAIWVTHDRREALGLADRVAVLGESEPGQPTRLLQLDRPEVVYARPANREVARLTGEASFLATSPGFEVIRPEHVRFHPDLSGDSVILARRFHGRDLRLRISGPRGELLADVPADSSLEVGARGSIELTSTTRVST